MITLSEFTNKWLGKRIDYDGVYQYQCVDLILQYLSDCHGITSGVWGNAIDYWYSPSPRLLQDFEKVTGTPQAGDIVIINGTNTNPYGHIMVAVNENTGLEQNGVGDGDGLNGDEVRTRALPLTRIAGLLRKKGAPKVSPTRTKLTPQDCVARFQNFAGRFDIKATDAVCQDRYEDPVSDEFLYGLLIHTRDLRIAQTQRADQAVAVLSIKDNEIARLNKEVESLKAQVGDNSKWETFKALIRELINIKG